MHNHSIGYLTKYFPLEFGKDNSLLRTVCDPVQLDSLQDESTQLLCDALRELMREYDGVGLAAPQIGQTQRIIAVTSWKDSRRGSKLKEQTIMINPLITYRSEKTFISEEGCLSLPQITGKVRRHNAIVVEYYDENGAKQEQKLRKFNAAIVQHEVDHLDGVLFIDKLA